MARRCDISKKSRQHGHRVSHAKNRRKHVFDANVQSKRVWVEEDGKKFSVKLKLSTKMLRTIDKIGLKAALKKHKMTLKDIT